MTNLVEITPEPSPDPTVEERIEHVLELALKGEVSSIALAWVRRDGSTSTSWSNAPSISTLIGAVSRLGYRLNRSIDE